MKGGFGNLFQNSNVSFSSDVNFRTLLSGIQIYSDFMETMQILNGNIRNLPFKNISLLRNFLMQLNLSRNLCPINSYQKALETFFMICLLFMRKVTIYEIILAQFFYDQFSILYTKYISTGLARQFDILDNSYDRNLSLHFVIDAFIYGQILQLCWYLMLLTFCSIYPLCYLSRQNSGKLTLILNVLIFVQYLRKCSIFDSVLELLQPTYEFEQPGLLNKTCKCFKSTLIHLEKIWALEYLEPFRKRIQLKNKCSPNTKQMLVPNKSSLLFIKIIRLIYSSNQELTNIIVESKGHECTYSVTNLHLLDNQGYSDQISSIKNVEDTHTEHSTDSTKPSANVPGNFPRVNPKRDAAVKAQQKWLSQVLMTKH